MKKVLCIGELLIDFICQDIDSNLIDGSQFLKKAGGAPANVCAAISKLSGKSSFIGKVGDDPFGRFLKKSLEEYEVGVENLVLDNNFNTTLAFVSLQSNGERDFIFNRGADENLKFSEIKNSSIEECDIVHFGSSTALLGGDFTDAYLSLFAKVHELDKFISFDPNYRVDLWKGRVDEFIKKSREYLQYSDFVKVSDEELELISGEKTIEAGVKAFHGMGAKIVAVTLGSEGTFLSNGKENGVIETTKVKSIDSTGAGDAFVGGVLFELAKENSPKEICNDFKKLSEIVAFGNRIGALTCTKMGAMEALPMRDALD